MLLKIHLANLTHNVQPMRKEVIFFNRANPTDCADNLFACLARRDVTSEVISDLQSVHSIHWVIVMHIEHTICVFRDRCLTAAVVK